MKYTSTLLAVTNMEKSKEFYRDVLGLEVVADFGANVTFSGGVVLQTLGTWKDFIKADKVTFQNNACELYFEEDNIDNFIEHLKTFDIIYVHQLFEHRWGQRVVRFYDLDKHIIEVGETLNVVVKRFISHGLTIEETAVRMDIPVDFIKLCLSA